MWTRSCPLARPSRAFAFSQIPFVVSQTTQVGFAETADGVQHVQRPAAFFDADFFQRFHPLEFFADFLRRNDDGSSRPVLSILRSRLLRRTGVAIRRRVDVSRL